MDTSEYELQINFPTVDVSILEAYRNKINDDKTYYCYKGSIANTQTNVTINSGSTSKPYAAQQLFIVGDMKDNNSSITGVMNLGTNSITGNQSRTLIILMNENSTVKDKNKQLFLCFPLEPDKANMSDPNMNQFINDVSLNTYNIENSKINSNKKLHLNINSLLAPNSNNLYFTYLSTKIGSVDASIYKYNESIYIKDLEKIIASETNFKAKINASTVSVNYKLLSEDNQPDTRVIFDLSIFKTNSTGSKIVSGVMNSSLNEVDQDQIYIQCTPAGASEETTPMKLVTAKNDSSQIQSYTTIFITVMVILITVWTNQKMIYGLLSDEFKKRIGIYENPITNSPAEMYMYFFLDSIPWINNAFFKEQRKYFNLTSFSINTDPSKRENAIRLFLRIFFFFLYNNIFHTIFYTKLHMSNYLFVILTLIFCQFLFFVNVSHADVNTLKS